MCIFEFIHEGLSTPVSGVMGFTGCLDCDPQQLTVLITLSCIFINILSSQKFKTKRFYSKGEPLQIEN